MARLRAMATTGGAAATSQLLVLATTPIVTRLIGPESFAVLGVFVALTGILSVGAHLGYAEAVLAAKEDEEARGVLSAVVVLSLAALAPIGLLAWAAREWNVMGAGILPAWAPPFVAFQSAVLALALAFQLFAMRVQRFGVLARTYLALGGSRAGGQVMAGFLAPFAGGLVAAEMASRVVSFAALLLGISRRELGLSLTKSRAAFRNFARFSALRAAATLLNALLVALPLLIISASFRPEQIGAMSFTLAVLLAPLGLIQKTVGDVFAGFYGRHLRSGDGSARTVLMQTALGLAALGVTAGAFLAATAPDLFPWLFGEEWRLAGETARLLAPGITAMIAVVPISSSLNILGRAGATLAFSVVRLVVLIGVAMLVPALGLDYLRAVGAISGALVLGYVIYGIGIIAINIGALRAAEAT